MINGKTKFRPVTGTDERIQNAQKNPGWVYFASDTGKIYVDLDNENRIAMGGAGVSVLYGHAPTTEPDDQGYYTLEFDHLEEEVTPKAGDLILNVGDGIFYRVIEIDLEARTMLCSILSVSGGGSGGGGGGVGGQAKKIGIRLQSLETSNLINGQVCYLTYTATSGTEADGTVMDERLTVNWVISEVIGTSTIDYAQGVIDVDTGSTNQFEFGTKLRQNTKSRITMWATGMNSGESTRKYAEVVTANLKLEESATFSNLNFYRPNAVSLQCNAIGAMDKILEFYFDDVLVESRTLNASSENFQSYTVKEELATHGHHLCRMELFQGIQSGNTVRKGLHAGTIQFEIGVVAYGHTTPVIWLGDYKTEYYNYDNIQIPYIVYNPENTAEAIVTLKKNGVEIASSPRTIDTTTLKWNYFEITDAQIDMVNRYSIGCGEESERNIIFTVVQDPSRKMEYVKPENLVLNFESRGRSNAESVVNRATWYNKDGSVKAKFTDFNWYNNGWVLDENNQSCLRISNGAEFSLPIGNMTFASNDSSKQSNSIEFQFKVRNIQDYSNLIKNTTRYKGDAKFYEAFLAQTVYSNYDAFLQYWLPIYPLVDENETRMEYDNLEFNFVQKDVSLAKAACKFVSGDDAAPIGLCLGANDAFFSNGTNTVNVNYVEDDMLYVTMVYSNSSRLLYIYINGVITGVIKSTANGAWTVAASEMVFNSEYCDIDLYNIRIYNTDLNVNDVVTNHAVDKKDVLIYDQNKLAEENTAINEYQFKFEKMLEYNDAHPNAPLMPYIVYDTTPSGTNDILPWSKKTKIPVKVEFVNTVLDAAYASGELEAKAIEDGLCSIKSTAEEKVAAVKKYYEHHCPSFTGDYCEIAVQGTSSEFYPRRNYKVKIKTKYHPSGKQYYHCNLNRGPFLQDYLEDQAKVAEDASYYGSESTRREGWYMDNYTNATNVWTMKVDYMESSGSYNAGFASMVGSAYSKHPLEDYIAAKAIANYEALATTIIPGNKDIRWEDFRTSLLGFPVLAFHKKSDGSYLYIGMYRMLLDKGSDEVLGFKPPKGVTANFLGGKDVRKKAECWEFCNNSRGFCSYRDPWKRVELSFKAPEGTPASEALTSGGAPIIADNIEYRYHDLEDFIDIVLDLNAADNDSSAEFEAETGIEILSESGKEKARDWLLGVYGNWEKVNKWVWSTNTDNVVSEGTYREVNVAQEMYQKNKYYISEQSTNADGSVKISYKISDGEFNQDVIYYVKNGDVYNAIKLTNNENYLYKPNKFYQLIDENYTPVIDEVFDSSIIFFELVVDDSYKERADLLVRKIASESVFESGKEYYYYNGEVIIREVGAKDSLAVSKATDVTAENFAEKKGSLYEPAPKTWGDKTYTHDTKEYRAAKFLNELTDHFDPEYLATYFIMTEVFECYDSRGKNCMMASWGPLKEGGDYIWYPIFYDIDTQLGINNTGIPSFEYNVDATEAGNYSTSDSLLWNNFYKYFKTSYILKKYKHLRGVTEGVQWPPLKSPTLKTIQNIENWYKFDKSSSGLSSLGGVKPLIATNLDMWWKYITITNDRGIKSGITGWLNRNGTFEVDTNGTYFYALQGDRSQSRQQFLTSRVEYIDSWLNQGNYQRGGSNNIRGRVAANNPTNTSDLWINKEAPYYNDKGEKNQKFDAEYWINLKPVRSSYVTVSDDAEAYPSKKYDGIKPVKFEITAIKDGVMESAGYPEQLLYVYGMNQMSDLGEMHNMYWQEFDLTGDATKLTTLKLGTDELMEVTDVPTISQAQGQKVTVDGKEYYQWFNKRMNLPSIPSSSKDIYGGMPLLKEVNLCNITVSTGSPTLDLTSCEKLQNFRATGSNFTQFSFSDGVALETLYLPASITRLELTEANLLRKVLKTYEHPKRNELDQLIAKEGLWIDGLFNNNQTNINVINIRGGALGYGSHEILKKIYDIRKSNTATMRVQLTNVDWTPYVQLVEGSEYIASEASLYFVDDGHMGFEPYKYDEFKFKTDVINGLVYKLDPAKQADSEQITNIEMFTEMANSNYWLGIADNTTCPNITGTVYIKNTVPVDEYTFRNGLAKRYPNLTFFFENVVKAYTAKFIIQEEDGTYSYAVDKDGNKAIQTIRDGWFNNPYITYKAEKDNWDFHGWSTTNNDTGLIGGVNNTQQENQSAWDAAASALKPNVYDYTFYAVFVQHAWKISYFAGEDENSLAQVYTENIIHGEVLQEPAVVPSIDESKLGLTDRYRFLGWSQNNKNLIVTQESAAKLTNISSIVSSTDMNFYAVFIRESVYTGATSDKYLIFEERTYRDAYDSSKDKSGYLVKPNPKFTLSGKVTLPTVYQGKPVITLGDFSTSQITHMFWLKEAGKGYNLLEIGGSAFNGCTTLQYFEMPTSVLAIRASAFNQTTNLQYFDLEDCDKLEIIEDWAFSGGWKSDKSEVLHLPSSLKKLGTMSFSYQNEMGNGGKVSDFSHVYIGEQGNPSKLQEISGANFQSAYHPQGHLTVYGPLSGWDPSITELVKTLIQPSFGGNITFL